MKRAPLRLAASAEAHERRIANYPKIGPHQVMFRSLAPVIWNRQLWRVTVTTRGQQWLESYPLYYINSKVNNGGMRVMLGVLVPPTSGETLWCDNEFLSPRVRTKVLALLDRAQIEADRFLIGPNGPAKSRY